MVTFEFLLTESSSIPFCLRPFSDGCLINIEQLHKHYWTGDSATHILPDSEIADDFMVGKSFPKYEAKKLSIAKQLGPPVLHPNPSYRYNFPMLPLLSSFVLWEDNSKSHNQATHWKQRWIYCCNNCLGICLSFKVSRFSNYVVLIYSDLIWHYSE